MVHTVALNCEQNEFGEKEIHGFLIKASDGFIVIHIYNNNNVSDS